MNPDRSLVLVGVTVVHGDRPALTDIDLTVAPGTSLALMGPNGSGKTTLLDVVAGVRTPTRGTVSRPRGPLGYVAQEPASRWMPVTVAEVLDMVEPRRRRRRPDAVAARHDAVERMDIGHLLDRTFHDLSGGERQRVRVAQALVRRPVLLLLDEPVTGLDPPSRQRILELVADETRRGTIVVVSTHHLDEARHCDAVALLATGLVAAGAPDEVLRTATLRRAFGPRTLEDHGSRPGDDGLLVLDDHGHPTAASTAPGRFTDGLLRPTRSDP